MKPVPAARARSGRAGVLLCLLVLAACGVDGPPSPPPADETAAAPPRSGVTLSGSASIGVVGSR